MHSLVPGLFRMIEHVQLQSVSEDLARNEGADLQKLSTPGLGRKRKAEESSLYDGNLPGTPPRAPIAVLRVSISPQLQNEATSGS